MKESEEVHLFVKKIFLFYFWNGEAQISQTKIFWWISAWIWMILWCLNRILFCRFQIFFFWNYFLIFGLLLINLSSDLDTTIRILIKMFENTKVQWKLPKFMTCMTVVFLKIEVKFPVCCALRILCHYFFFENISYDNQKFFYECYIIHMYSIILFSSSDEYVSILQSFYRPKKMKRAF